MFDETPWFDTDSSVPDGGSDDFSLTIPNCTSMEEDFSYTHQQYSAQQDASATTSTNIQIQQIGASSMDGSTTQSNLMQQVIQDSKNQILSCEDQSNWDPNILRDVGYYNHLDQTLPQTVDTQIDQQVLSTYSAAPDLPNLLPNSTMSFANSVQDSITASPVLYDPLYHLNLPPQPPLFKELLQSLPNGYSWPASTGVSLLVEVADEREGNGKHLDNGVSEFSREIACFNKGRRGKMTKHYTSERDRRVHLNGKFSILKSLVPNPAKNDRASIIGYAIEYIGELKSTVNKLKIMVERKRCSRERKKRQKIEDDGDVDSCSKEAISLNQSKSADDSLRCSWHQRKSEVDTEVDVRIIDDEATIKLVHKKKINCLLFVSKTLDELQLDLQHASGGIIGDHCSFLVNTKICEGSSLYASAIAKRLIEAVDQEPAA